MLRGSRAFSGKIHRPFLAQVVPPFTTMVSGGDTSAVQVGTTKDRGLYNKPSVAVHPGALAAGTLPQYNTYIHICIHTHKRAHTHTHTHTHTDYAYCLRTQQVIFLY